MKNAHTHTSALPLGNSKLMDYNSIKSEHLWPAALNTLASRRYPLDGRLSELSWCSECGAD